MTAILKNIKDIKDRIYDNSPQSETVYKVVGTVFSLYTVAVLWHHKATIYENTLYKWEHCKVRSFFQRDKCENNDLSDDDSTNSVDIDLQSIEGISDSNTKSHNTVNCVFINKNGEKICEL